MRYVHRSLPRVLEDYAPVPIVPLGLDFAGVLAGVGNNSYVIDNIHAGLETLDPASIGYPEVLQAFFEDLLLAGSGQPLTALAAHPIYGNSGEIRETVRGEGFEAADGFRTRRAM